MWYLLWRCIPRPRRRARMSIPKVPRTLCRWQPRTGTRVKVIPRAMLRPMRRGERIARQRRRCTQWYIARQIARVRAVVSPMSIRVVVMAPGRDVEVAATVVVVVKVDVVAHAATVDVMAGPRAHTQHPIVRVVVVCTGHGLQSHGVVQLETVLCGHRRSPANIEEARERGATGRGRERGRCCGARGSTMCRGEDASAGLWGYQN